MFQAQNAATSNYQKHVVFPEGYKHVPILPKIPTQIIKSGDIKILPPRPRKSAKPYSLSAKANADSTTGSTYPRPPYSYANLIMLALKNSQTGSLCVNNIYKFISENFPFFDNPIIGTNWQNAVRHTLSLHKGFAKIVKANPLNARSNEWTLNPKELPKLKKELMKASNRNRYEIKGAMSNPDHFEPLLEDQIFIQNFDGLIPIKDLNSIDTSLIDIENRGSQLLQKFQPEVDENYDSEPEMHQFQVGCDVQIHSDDTNDGIAFEDDIVENPAFENSDAPLVIAEVI